MIKAFDLGGQDFKVLLDSVRDGDPELNLASLEFWERFVTIEQVVFKDDFKKRLFAQ